MILSDKQVNWINLKTKKMVLASLLPVRYVCYRVGIIVNENKSNSIYLTGDQINCGVANSVPIWNSKIRIWNPVADMINKRLNFGSTLLNKKLYVVGGINENEEYLNSMDMYDPTTNTWSECSPMVTKRRNPGVSGVC